MKKKVQYAPPSIVGTRSLPQELICASVRFNIQVHDLDNVNADSSADEIFYFES